MGMQHLNITLPDDVAELVRMKVASGEFATESDVIEEGLHRLAEQDESLETWLVEAVGPAYDALRANPEYAVDANHVRARIQALRG